MRPKRLPEFTFIMKTQSQIFESQGFIKSETIAYQYDKKKKKRLVK